MNDDYKALGQLARDTYMNAIDDEGVFASQETKSLAWQAAAEAVYTFAMQQAAQRIAETLIKDRIVTHDE